MADKAVKFWRGSRALYNILVVNGALDTYTRYSIHENDGSWSEYYGADLLSVATGQLLPVIDIVSSLPACNKGDRYIVGHDATFDAEGEKTVDENYYLVVAGENGASEAQIEPFTDKHCVRVRNRQLKCYQIVNGVMMTYDDADCGEF